MYFCNCVYMEKKTSRPLITLVSDWGFGDHYLGSVKGKLYSLIPDANIVDISHNIGPQDIIQGAFIVKNACFRFPPKTIHIIDVDCVENKKEANVVIECEDQYFITTDNGLPSEVFKDKKIQITAIEIPQDSDFFTFTALDLFTKVAAMIANGEPIQNIGNPRKALFEKHFQPYEASGNAIHCMVTYIDHYGNLFLNISAEDFKKILDDRPYEIRIANEIVIKQMKQSYHDVPQFCPLLTVSSTGYLQLALRGGNASQMFRLKVLDSVIIELIPNKEQTP